MMNIEIEYRDYTKARVTKVTSQLGASVNARSGAGYYSIDGTLSFDTTGNGDNMYYALLSYSDLTAATLVKGLY